MLLVLEFLRPPLHTHTHTIPATPVLSLAEEPAATLSEKSFGEASS